ncbi:hypothetical protein FRX31_005933 [Thalictrum thalictroides]|uniref:Uncharacterized protein n=1 Tax=Thalictrum thalictroides TaxID=46969 RepID=A0A7J6X7E8_THATH|nr:hypothetical protein FRX31_005933 [Thalictrum thalictroides]
MSCSTGLLEILHVKTGRVFVVLTQIASTLIRVQDIVVPARRDLLETPSLLKVAKVHSSTYI